MGFGMPPRGATFPNAPIYLSHKSHMQGISSKRVHCMDDHGSAMMN